LEKVPLEAAAGAPSHEPGPPEAAERREMRDTVVRAIRALPEDQRTATTLFYIDGYAQREIAEFLEVPVSTVKSRLHASRKRLKERMMNMVSDELRKHAVPGDFAQQLIRRIQHWERFGPREGFGVTAEEKAEKVMSDPEWIRLVEVEVALEPLSAEAREIRKQISCLERCHESFTDNVRSILEMIGSMTPGAILDCGQASVSRCEDAQTYRRALQTWMQAAALPRDADDCAREVFELLGQREEKKAALAQHLIKKLNDNAYGVYRDEDEDFEQTESRIQHLDICNYNWHENLRIVLKEIAAGRRLHDWHTPEGYNAHGDCPNRVEELRDTMACAPSWAEGQVENAGQVGTLLGEPTPEKRWLVASLCKTVSAHHHEFEGQRPLARPRL